MNPTDRIGTRRATKGIGVASRPRRLEPTVQDWFLQACEHEEGERFHEALRCYRHALEADGPSAVVCFNLANVLYRQRRKVEAAEYYRQALALDDRSHAAWNNLGVVLCELRQCDEAVRAFQRSIALAPWFADAIYNLADCLDERGLCADARRYWHDYLRTDSFSEWGAYARSRLDGE